MLHEGNSAFNVRWQPQEHYSAHAHRADSLRRDLAGHGIKIPGGSRLDTYLEAVTAAATAERGEHPPRLPHPSLLSQAVCELREICCIVEQLSKPPAVPNWMTKVETLVSGSMFPRHDKAESSPRDIQFELYVAAVLRASGMAVLLEEPDIVVEWKENRFAVAAKRPKSETKVERHVKKASRQIVRSGLQGIVAIDISYLEAFNKPVVVNDIAATHTLGETFANGVVQERGQRIQKLVDPAHVFGLLVHVSTKCVLLPKHQLNTGIRWTVSNLCQLDDPRHPLLMQVARQIATVPF